MQGGLWPRGGERQWLATRTVLRRLPVVPAGVGGAVGKPASLAKKKAAVGAGMRGASIDPLMAKGGVGRDAEAGLKVKGGGKEKDAMDEVTARGGKPKHAKKGCMPM